MDRVVSFTPCTTPTWAIVYNRDDELNACDHEVWQIHGFAVYKECHNVIPMIIFGGSLESVFETLKDSYTLCYGKKPEIADAVKIVDGKDI